MIYEPSIAADDLLDQMYVRFNTTENSVEFLDHRTNELMAVPFQIFMELLIVYGLTVMQLVNRLLDRTDTLHLAGGVKVVQFKS